MDKQRSQPDVSCDDEAPRIGSGGRRVWYALAAAVLLALGVRLYGVAHEDFWLDEIFSLTSSAGRFAELRNLPHGEILEGLPCWADLTRDSTWSSVWRGMKADSHPPLYFLLLSSWRRLVGDGEFMLRLLSVIASVTSLIPLALIFLEYGKRWSGVVTVMVVALSFSYVHAAEQCRPYALAMLWLSLSFLALVKLERRCGNSGHGGTIVWGTVYAAASYLSLMTHYLCLLFVAGQVVFALTRLRHHVRWIWGGAALVTLLTFAITWGPSVASQLDYMAEQSWRREHHPDHVVRTLQRVADLPVRLLFAHAEFKFSIVRSALGLAALAGAIWLLRRRRCGATIVFLAWYLVPVLILAAIDLFQDKQTLAMLRYAVLAAPGLAGMLVLAVNELGPRLRTVATAGLVITMLVTLPHPASDNPHNRIASALIADQVQPGTLLVVDAVNWQPFWVSQIYNNLAYYLRQRLAPPWPPVVLLRDAPALSLISEMAAYDRIVVVSPRVDAIPNPVPGQFYLVDRTSHVHQIGFIYLFERIPSAENP